MIPFGDKLRDYFRKYESAQSHIDAIIKALYDGQDELRKDNAALEQEKVHLWETMQRLTQYIYIARAPRRGARREDRRDRGHRPRQGQGAARRRAVLRAPEAPGPAHPAWPSRSRATWRSTSSARTTSSSSRASTGRPRPRRRRVAYRGDRRAGAREPEARARPDHGAEHDDVEADRVDVAAPRDPERRDQQAGRVDHDRHRLAAVRRSTTSTSRWTRSTRSRRRRSTRWRRRSPRCETEIDKSQAYLARVRASEARGASERQRRARPRRQAPNVSAHVNADPPGAARPPVSNRRRSGSPRRSRVAPWSRWGLRRSVVRRSACSARSRRRSAIIVAAPVYAAGHLVVHAVRRHRRANARRRGRRSTRTRRPSPSLDELLAADPRSRAGHRRGAGPARREHRAPDDPPARSARRRQRAGPRGAAHGHELPPRSRRRLPAAARATSPTGARSRAARRR